MYAALSQIAIAASTGPLSHWAYYIHGERDLEAANIARAYMGLTAIITLLKHQHENSSFKIAFEETAFLVVVHATFLFASIVWYRLFLSPIHHLPGPLRLRLSKLSHVYDVTVSKNCVELEKLRAKYGDVVRTGPNEVTLFTPEAYQKVHGPESMCTRAGYYDTLHPLVSLDTTRDPVVHTHKRKVWDQAFSMRSLHKIEDMVYEQASKLVEQLRDRIDQPLNMSKWLEFYTWDMMGRFGLTIDFKNTTSGKSHPILNLYRMAHNKIGPLSPAPWIKHLMMGIPYIERMKYYRQFMDWANDEVNRNIQNADEDRIDVMSYVIEDAKKHGGIEANWNFILGDFVLVMSAGSDPICQTLANLMCYLIHNPTHRDKIRDELSSIDIYNYTKLKTLTHLNACIYETLRLNPAVPSAGLRLPPQGGIQIGDTYIPEGTTMCIPQYSLGQDERNYTSPKLWIPERFTTRKDLVRDQRAFVPWNTGKYECIGKNFSLMEIRIAAALILTEFEVEFAPGEEGKRVFEDADDFFTVSPGRLEVVVRRREGDGRVQ